jgi:hypothetical protein
MFDRYPLQLEKEFKRELGTPSWTCNHEFDPDEPATAGVCRICPAPASSVGVRTEFSAMGKLGFRFQRESVNRVLLQQLQIKT